MWQQASEMQIRIDDSLLAVVMVILRQLTQKVMISSLHYSILTYNSTRIN